MCVARGLGGHFRIEFAAHLEHTIRYPSGTIVYILSGERIACAENVVLSGVCTYLLTALPCALNGALRWISQLSELSNCGNTLDVLSDESVDSCVMSHVS